MQMNEITLKGTGAILYVGLGCHPDEVEVTNLTARTGLKWSRRMGISVAGAHLHGLAIAAAGTRAVVATDATYGLSLYAGGDLMAAASTTYLVRNEDDQRSSYSTSSPVTTYTVGSATNKTGNFNVEAHTDYVGPGSFVMIGDQLAQIVAMTSNGEQANEVTLDIAITHTTSPVHRITSRWDFSGAKAGVVVPKGIIIGASATVNASTELLLVRYIVH